jgi:hypothetical protein
MWQGDEAVEVRRSEIDGIDAPEQFLWRGRLWRVCAVQAHWVETAAWWEPSTASVAYDVQEASGGVAVGVIDKTAVDAGWGPQRSVYRVEAGSGRHGRREVFDLAFDPDSGRWQLERVTGR